jgi:ELWxxDGT repeat protein
MHAWYLSEPLERRLLLSVQLIDINPNTADSNPYEFTEVSGTIFFSAFEPRTGSELWKSNGTAAGTVMVKEIAPAIYDGPEALTNVNGTLFFAANDGVHGWELWRSDGTPAGTRMVDDLYPYYWKPSLLTVAGDLLYFVGPTGLYVSDGTSAGTRRIVSVVGGIESITLIDGAIYYQVASYDYSYNDLWRTDPSGADAQLIQPLVSDPPVEYNGRAYFVNQSNQLLSSAATGPAELVATIEPSSGTLQRALGVVNGKLILTGTLGYEQTLWASDGTAAGTSRIAAFPGTRTVNAQVAGNKLFYLVFNDRYPQPMGTFLYRTDGTAEGTSFVMVTSTYRNSGFGEMAVLHDQLYFVEREINSERNVVRLWQTDGTPQGTRFISEVARRDPLFDSGENLRPFDLQTCGDRLMLPARSIEAGFEPWISDGTPQRTHLLKDVNTTGASSYPWVIGVVNGRTIFTADDGLHGTRGRYLWLTDGTQKGTKLLAEVTPQPRHPTTEDMNNGVLFHGVLYFSAVDESRGGQLWRSDGTPHGTYVVRDIPYAPSPPTMVVIQDRLYFFGTYGGMWSTDGTESGTQQIKFAGEMPMNVSEVVAADHHFFLVSNQSVSQTLLWVSDGTAEGTVPLRSGFLRSLTALNDLLIFTGYNGGNDALWRSDGTVAGTVPIGGPTGCTALRAMGDVVYFISAGDLWKTDGSEQGTVRITNLGTIDASLVPSKYDMVVAGSMLYFTADGPKGTEVWRSDGTQAGTILLKDIRPGGSGSDPRYLYGTAKHVFFSADDGVHGEQTWMSDGTPAGTVVLTDLAGGPTGFNPGPFAGTSGTLAFAGTSIDSGRQLLIYRPPRTSRGPLLPPVLSPTGSSRVAAQLPADREMVRSSASALSSLWKPDSGHRAAMVDPLTVLFGGNDVL